MIRVIDASVAAKWVVEEDGSPAARRVLEQPGSLIAPDLLIAEVGNVLWKKQKRGSISSAQAREAIVWLPEFFDRLFDSATLATRALELAVSHDITVCDALYVVLAEAAGDGCQLVTADQGMADLARRAGVAAMMLKP